MRKRYLSTDETAEFLRMTREALATMRWRGEGPRFVKLRKRVLYDFNDLEAWLERHKVFTKDTLYMRGV